MEAAFLAQEAADAVARVGEHFERTFHPPFGLRFAGMLAGIEPDLEFAFAHFEAVDRLAVERGAKVQVIDAFRGCGFGHEIVMTLHRIGREIGEPGDVAGRRIADRQRAAVFVLVIGRCGAAPVVAVFRNAGVVAGPAAGIGAGFQIGDLEHQFAALCPADAEVEPLLEFAAGIERDGKLRARAVDGKDFDIAAVESRIDPDIAHLGNLDFYRFAIIAGKIAEQRGGEGLCVCLRLCKL